mmetsp:Transcript_15168/g.24640  ORF Transcript_15168/g.24640 Transcript_15168/m.24640 type:complete len:143 (-) Transcript_15168:16-444(-)
MKIQQPKCLQILSFARNVDGSQLPTRFHQFKSSRILYLYWGCKCTSCTSTAFFLCLIRSEIWLSLLVLCEGQQPFKVILTFCSPVTAFHNALQVICFSIYVPICSHSTVQDVEVSSDDYRDIDGETSEMVRCQEQPARRKRA